MTTPVTTTRTVILPPDELDERMASVKDRFELADPLKSEETQKDGVAQEGRTFVEEQSGREVPTYVVARQSITGQLETVERDEDGDPVVLEGDSGTRYVAEDYNTDRSAKGDDEGGGDDDTADSSGFDDDD